MRKRIFTGILLCILLVVSASTVASQASDLNPLVTYSPSYTVYITKTGSKYHMGNCRHLGRSKIAIRLGDAKARDFTPCSVCNPPD